MIAGASAARAADVAGRERRRNQERRIGPSSLKKDRRMHGSLARLEHLPIYTSGTLALSDFGCCR
jgi:hypothetical protein